jgi:hypothetical protein
MAEEYNFYLINPIPGNPRPVSRNTRNKKCVGIPGIREREIPGMKHYSTVWVSDVSRKSKQWDG